MSRDDDTLRHLAYWKAFPDFAAGFGSVSLGLATYGFNPF